MMFFNRSRRVVRGMRYVDKLRREYSTVWCEDVRRRPLAQGASFCPGKAGKRQDSVNRRMVWRSFGSTRVSILANVQYMYEFMDHEVGGRVRRVALVYMK